jgi:hypothetical protein
MMPEEAVTENEQTEDVSDEYEPDPYDDGYELSDDERAIVELES